MSIQFQNAQLQVCFVGISTKLFTLDVSTSGLRWFVSLHLINYTSFGVWARYFCRISKATFEPMMVSLLTHICVTRPQWVNVLIKRCSKDVDLCHCHETHWTNAISSNGTFEIPHKISCPYHIKCDLYTILRALIFKSSHAFLKRPRANE